MKIKRRPDKLRKKAQKGLRGYPVATVAFYGADNTLASKVAVGIVPGEGERPEQMKRWFSDDTDVRYDADIGAEIIAFIESAGARSVVLSDGIIGCPHEEGVDYPDGEHCPKCPFWANRDRWTGELIQ
jgi:hypothetical protein